MCINFVTVPGHAFMPHILFSLSYSYCTYSFSHAHCPAYLSFWRLVFLGYSFQVTYASILKNLSDQVCVQVRSLFSLFQETFSSHLIGSPEIQLSQSFNGSSTSQQYQKRRPRKLRPEDRKPTKMKTLLVLAREGNNLNIALLNLYQSC